MEIYFRMKKSCLVARYQYAATFFLSYTKSYVWKRLFAKSRARKHDFHINFLKKKLIVIRHYDLWIFSLYEMFIQYYFILFCQSSTGTDNLQKLHCMQQNDVIHEGNITLQLSNTIELNTLKIEKKSIFLTIIKHP